MERYIPIARRYRPKTFSQVVGQDHIIRVLQNQLSTGRVPHAFLFSGTRGVGKTTTARLLAKALNCEKGITPQPCNQCRACKAIDQGNFMGLLEIDGASNRGIDEVRNLQEIISQRALEGRFRVVIIDEVHMLTQEAFNALLKTLEEPPEHVVFVLATTDYQKLPVTIISRTVHFHFREIPQEIIKENIMEISEKEGFEIEEGAAELIAQSAEGSLRDAQTALEKVIAFSQGRITRKDVEQALGLVPQELMGKITRAVAEGDRKEILSAVRNIVLQGYSLRRFVRDYMGFLRRVLMGKIAGKDEFPGLSKEDLLRYLNILLEGEYRLRNAPDPRVYLELMLLRMSFLRHVVDLEELIDSLLKGKVPEMGQIDVPSSASRESDKKSQVAEEITNIEMALSRKSAILSTSFKEADRVVLKGDILSLFYSGDKSFYYRKMNEKKEILRSVAGEVLGRSIEVEIHLAGEESAEKTEEEEGEDPKVLLLRRIFKAKEIKEE